MKTFRAQFNGRLVGSQGITFLNVINITAKDTNEATAKIYEKFEHITELKFTEIKQSAPEKYGLNSFNELFDYAIESVINGQFTQFKEIMEDLTTRQRENFRYYLQGEYDLKLNHINYCFINSKL